MHESLVILFVFRSARKTAFSPFGKMPNDLVKFYFWPIINCYKLLIENWRQNFTCRGQDLTELKNTLLFSLILKTLVASICSHDMLATQLHLYSLFMMRIFVMRITDAKSHDSKCAFLFINIFYSRVWTWDFHATLCSLCYSRNWTQIFWIFFNKLFLF